MKKTSLISLLFPVFLVVLLFGCLSKPSTPPIEKRIESNPYEGMTPYGALTTFSSPYSQGEKHIDQKTLNLINQRQGQAFSQTLIGRLNSNNENYRFKALITIRINELLLTLRNSEKTISWENTMLSVGYIGDGPLSGKMLTDYYLDPDSKRIAFSEEMTKWIYITLAQNKPVALFIMIADSTFSTYSLVIEPTEFLETYHLLYGWNEMSSFERYIDYSRAMGNSDNKAE